MSMIPEDMADLIIKRMDQLVEENPQSLTPEIVMENLWESICEYVSNNAEVNYQWEAVNPDNELDPKTSWIGKIQTGGVLKPLTDSLPENALIDLSNQMNSLVNTWTIIPEEGFSTEGLTITNSSIEIKKSMVITREEAMIHLSTDIITGIQQALPPEHSGSHDEYIGKTIGGIIL